MKGKNNFRKSPLQERKVGPRSGQYLLVLINSKAMCNHRKFYSQQIKWVYFFTSSQSLTLLSVCLRLVTPGLVLSGKSLFVGKSVGHGFMLHFVQGRRLNTSSGQAVSAYPAEGNYCSL